MSHKPPNRYRRFSYRAADPGFSTLSAVEIPVFSV